MVDMRQIALVHQNFVFMGEAGSGKSEIAVNFAKLLSEQGDKPVHFFDLDMTKPLFRSRDLVNELVQMGILFHFEEQFMDAPTAAGGVSRMLRDKSSYVVMDVGGDYIGARSIGSYAALLGQPSTVVYYVINSYRPWSLDLEHIDRVMAETLGVSHIRLDQVRLIGNSNLGIHTTARDVIDGSMQLLEMVAPHKKFDFFCVCEQLHDPVRDALPCPLLPIHLYLTYPWETH